MLPVRCKCGRMVKAGGECKVCSKTCLLHFQDRPRMFAFVKEFAEEKGITIEEAMVGDET